MPRHGCGVPVRYVPLPAGVSLWPACARVYAKTSHNQLGQMLGYCMVFSTDVKGRLSACCHLSIPSPLPSPLLHPCTRPRTYLVPHLSHKSFLSLIVRASCRSGHWRHLGVLRGVEASRGNVGTPEGYNGRQRPLPTPTTGDTLGGRWVWFGLSQLGQSWPSLVRVGPGCGVPQLS